ncbi:MAG: hypothetical protein KGZ97_11945 [Bacteroidetes bacterium]|nr:hypothetical protein [Bacteroidota bacterium]
MEIGANKICVSNPEKTKSFVRCHRFFPSNHQRKMFGELLFILEIKLTNNHLNKSLNIAEEVFEIIINGLRTNYYRPGDLRSDNLEESFENALQKLNRLIHQESISSRDFENTIKNLNAVIGLSHDEKIYFTSVGSAQVFIIKKNKIVDLVSEEINPSTVRNFSQIISGNLEKNDVLFFSTSNFLDYFVFEKLCQIVNKLSGSEAAQKLTSLLKNLNDKISVGALLLKKENKKEMPEEMTIKKDNLANQNLEEKPVIKIEKNISYPNVLKIRVEEERGPEIQQLKIKEEKTLSLPIEKKEKDVVSVDKKPNQTPKIKFFSKIKISKLYLSFIKKIFSPKITKPLKIFSLILIIFIIVSFSILFIKNKNQEENTLKFFLSLQEIQKNNALLNAALNYNDQKTVDLLIKELKKQISSLQARTMIEKELLKNIKNDLEQNTDKIYGVIKINEPEIITNLSSLGKKDDLKKIVYLQNNNFIIINQVNNEVYLYNAKNKEFSLIIKNDFYINRAIKYDENNIFLVGETQIKNLNLINQKTKLLEIETQRKNFNITDAEIYENKLYILDTKNNQIFKYFKNDDGFDKELPWITENINLTNINSIIIDGSVYLLDKSGKILKFFLGKSQPIIFSDPYPPTIKPTKLLASASLAYLYLLEPDQKRILVYDKNGNLQKQFVSEEFKDLQDMVTNEDESIIFILNKNDLYKIELK